MYQVLIACQKFDNDWDNFLIQESVCHHAFLRVWPRLIEKHFGHKDLSLICIDSDNSVQGIAPLVFFKSALFGRALISLPYLNCGGILSRSQQSYQFLRKKIEDLATEHEVQFTECRTFQKKFSSEWILRNHKVTYQRDLPEKEELLWKDFSSKLRSQIRRPEKAGIVCEHGRSECVDDFFKVFSENMRDLGSPHYSKQFMTDVIISIPQSEIIVAKHHSRPVAAGILIGLGSSLEIPWASSLRSYNNVSANMALYWHALKRGITLGYKTFDFGRSTPDSGPAKFKEQWGAKSQVLDWEYFGKNIPETSKDNPVLHLAQSGWKYLPLSVSRNLGPILFKMLPV